MKVSCFGLVVSGLRTTLTKGQLSIHGKLHFDVYFHDCRYVTLSMVSDVVNMLNAVFNKNDD